MKRKKIEKQLCNFVRNDGCFAEVVRSLDMEQKVSVKKKNTSRRWTFVFAGATSFVCAVLISIGAILIVGNTNKNTSKSDVSSTSGSTPSSKPMYEYIPQILYNAKTYIFDNQATQPIDASLVETKLSQTSVYVAELGTYINVNIYSIFGIDSEVSVAIEFDSLNYYYVYKN